MGRHVVLMKFGVAFLVAGLAVVAVSVFGAVRNGFGAPQIVSDSAPANGASVNPQPSVRPEPSRPAPSVSPEPSVKPAPSAVDEDRNDVHALSTLMHNGADLAKRTTITHYLYVPELGDARAAVDAVEPRGFKAVLERPQTSTSAGIRTDWGVVASRDETPTIEHLRATRAFFKALAARYHGSYDGWEAAVVH